MTAGTHCLRKAGALRLPCFAGLQREYDKFGVRGDLGTWRHKDKGDHKKEALFGFAKKSVRDRVTLLGEAALARILDFDKFLHPKNMCSPRGKQL